VKDDERIGLDISPGLAELHEESARPRPITVPALRVHMPRQPNARGNGRGQH
jgi:hypothetical protein